jgi:hypothetical protein
MTLILHFRWYWIYAASFIDYADITPALLTADCIIEPYYWPLRQQAATHIITPRATATVAATSFAEAACRAEATSLRLFTIVFI